MKHVLVSVLPCLFALVQANAQSGDSKAILQSKLNYCKKENADLENNVTKYKGLLELQSKNISDLKVQIGDLKQEVKELEQRNSDLEAISVTILNLAIKFEREEKFAEAAEVYKMLIKTYPTSLEAASSRLKVEDFKQNSSKK